MILITRPKEEALRTKRKLEDIGYHCKIFPLLKIELIKNALADLDLDSLDYIIITSQNVVKALISNNLRFKTPIYVVGQKTSSILSEAGFDIAKNFMTVKEMRDFIIRNGYANFLYLSGAITAWPLSEEMQNLGFNISKKVVYKSAAVEFLPVDLLQGIKTILFYSPRTAGIFAELCHFDLSDVSAICISENTANKLKLLGFKSVKISHYPNEKSILELL